MRLSQIQSVDYKKGDWKRAYLADPVMGSKYFTALGDPVDLMCWHSGRLWMADRILVPSGKVREVLSIMHENVLQVIVECGSRMILWRGNIFPPHEGLSGGVRSHMSNVSTDEG